MTAVINKVLVSGTPEEIKALIDLYSPSVVIKPHYGENDPTPEGWKFTGTHPDVKLADGNTGGNPL